MATFVNCSAFVHKIYILLYNLYICFINISSSLFIPDFQFTCPKPEQNINLSRKIENLTDILYLELISSYKYVDFFF